MKKKKLEKRLKVADALAKLIISVAALLESLADVLNALNR